MTNNNIALQVKKARLANILTQVDHYLSSCGEPPDHIARHYVSFILENQITREVPDELKKVLPPGHTSPPVALDETNANSSTKASVSQPTHHYRKRKSKKKHPKAIKSLKEDPFLSLGPLNPPQPP